MVYLPPSLLTTDRGTQFTSALWRSLSSMLGTNHIKTTSYHPCSNGMVERYHRNLKSALGAYGDSSRWVEFLPMVLPGLRSVVKSDLQCSSAELVYGCTLSLPGQLFSSPGIVDDTLSDPLSYAARLSKAMSSVVPTGPRVPSARACFIPGDLSTCTHVYVRRDAHRRPLRPVYDGPYTVVSRADKYFKVVVNGRHDSVSIDRVKPAYAESVSTTDSDFVLPAPESV